MLGGKPGDIYIELEPIRRPFYNAGDTVRGMVILEVSAQNLSLSDIQVKVRCDEWSAVARNDDRKQAMVEKREARHAKRVARRQHRGRARKRDDEEFTVPRPSALTEHKRHVDLVFTLAKKGLDGPNGKLPREAGRYQFEFEIELPDTILSLPPHCPVPTRNGLKVGVEWSVKAVAHRSGALKSSLRTSTDIPVHPTAKGVQSPDLSRRAELSGQKIVSSSKKLLGKPILGSKSKSGNDLQVLAVRLGYPDAGIPQGPLKPTFALSVAATSGVVTIWGISIFLVQRCLASVHKKLELKDAYKNLFPFGKLNALLKVDETPKDISSLVAEFALKDVFASPFASSITTVSYELRLEVEVITPKKGRRELLVFEVPVNFLGPGLCWPESLTDKVFEAEAHLASPESDDTEFESDSSAPRESDLGLPSYEEAIPSTDTRVIDELTYSMAKSGVAN